MVGIREWIILLQVFCFNFQWQIGLGETLCYRYSASGASATVAPSMIEVTYQSVRHVYPVSNSYYFKLAQADVKCVCDCPGNMVKE